MLFIEFRLHLSPNIANHTKMKKKLLGAIVILFVTIAFLLVVDDISKSKNPESQETLTEMGQQPDLVITNEE